MLKGKTISKLLGASFLLVAILLASSVIVPASAHVEGGVRKTIGNYMVEFGVNPKFPIAGQKVKLLFSVQNVTTGEHLSNFQATIGISQGSDSVFSIKDAVFREGDIDVLFIFPVAGNYIVSITLASKGGPFVFEFPVEVTAGEAAATQSQPVANETDKKSIVPVSNPVLFDPATVLSVLAGIGILPVYFGGLIAVGIKKLKGSTKFFLASVAVGIAISEFFDLMSGASALGIEFGYGINPVQIILVLSFALGLLSLAAIEAWRKRMSDVNFSGLGTVAFLMALGLGFHSLGEGIVVGFDLKSGFGLTSIAAIATQALSFALHKAGEGFVVMIPLLFLRVVKKRDFGLMGIIMGIPIIAGTTIAYAGASGIISSYAFAAGAGAISYILLKLISLARSEKDAGIFGFNYSVFIGIFLGLMFLYLAGLLHTTRF